MNPATLLERTAWKDYEANRVDCSDNFYIGGRGVRWLFLGPDSWWLDIAWNLRRLCAVRMVSSCNQLIGLWFVHKNWRVRK